MEGTEWLMCIQTPQCVHNHATRINFRGDGAVAKDNTRRDEVSAV